MLFYISTNETIQDEDGNEQLPISELYDYYIVEIREFPTAYTAEVDRIIQPQNPDSFPDGVNYIRPKGDAKELIYENLSLEQYAYNPAWVVLDTTPDSAVDDFVMFKLSNMDDPEKVGEVLRRIYHTLDSDDFDRLDWEERKLRFEEEMDGLTSFAGLIITLFQL